MTITIFTVISVEEARKPVISQVLLMPNPKALATGRHAGGVRGRRNHVSPRNHEHVVELVGQPGRGTAAQNYVRVPFQGALCQRNRMIHVRDRNDRADYRAASVHDRRVHLGLACESTVGFQKRTKQIFGLTLKMKIWFTELIEDRAVAAVEEFVVLEPAQGRLDGIEGVTTGEHGFVTYAGGFATRSYSLDDHWRLAGFFHATVD